ncbi:MAG: NusG domain II-containing protein [Ruminococcaceae bacterium]|nr:NusG domain II-containing protein [Oscillospiraceae bacterium]
MVSKKLRNDILLVGGIVVFALLLFVVFKLNLKDGNLVKVSIDNQMKDCYNFNEDGEYTITSGKNTNVLVIKDGTAFIKSADCPDKICVHHRPISKVGETIVCLPHKVVVEIIKE